MTKAKHLMQADYHKAEIVSLKSERHDLLSNPTMTVQDAIDGNMYMDVLTADLKSIDALINSHTFDGYAHITLAEIN